MKTYDFFTFIYHFLCNFLYSKLHLHLQISFQNIYPAIIRIGAESSIFQNWEEDLRWTRLLSVRYVSVLLFSCGKHQTATRGKPSTWFPPGMLVQSDTFSTFFKISELSFFSSLCCFVAKLNFTFIYDLMLCQFKALLSLLR